jgi:hypothetical protein
MKLTLDRRRHRTDDPAEALRLQLDAVRRRAALDALVLADGDGLVIAHAGDRDGCAALAAAAPLVGRASGPRALVPADAGRTSGPRARRSIWWGPVAGSGATPPWPTRRAAWRGSWAAERPSG